MPAIKLAFEATVITMIFIGIMALFINHIKEKKFCVVCGDPSIGDFCCESCENLHYDEEELSREEEIDDEDDEQEEMRREEMKMKAGLNDENELKEWQRGGLAHPYEFIKKEDK